MRRHFKFDSYMYRLNGLSVKLVKIYRLVVSRFKPVAHGEIKLK